MKNIDCSYLNEFYDRAVKSANNSPINLYGAGEASFYVLDLDKEAHTINIFGDTNYGSCGNIIPKCINELPHDSELYICSKWNNISAIYDRISQYCTENNITILDLNGNQLCDKKSNVCSDPFEAGKQIIEPILANLLFWLVEQAEEKQLMSVLLGSRDGWILSRMCDAIPIENFKIPCFKYIYISRVLSTKSGIKNLEDYRFACNRRYDGDKKSMLMNRFGLREEDISDPINERDDDWYKPFYEKVIELSANNRKEYQQYISKEVGALKNVGYFDFVSTGTCQFWLEKIFDQDFNGLYFLAKHVKGRECMKMASIGEEYSCYSPLNHYIDSAYILFEKIMTSEEPPIIGMEHGSFIFDDEVRSEQDIFIMKNIHEGIMDAFMERLSQIDKIAFDKLELEESMYKFFCTRFSFWNDEDLIIKDDYCNFFVGLN